MADQRLHLLYDENNKITKNTHWISSAFIHKIHKLDGCIKWNYKNTICLLHSILSGAQQIMNTKTTI